MNKTTLTSKHIKTKKNSFKTVLPAKSVNEGFSRIICSAFISALDPTLEEVCDIKTAVSEAVTNCIVHAYANEPDERKKLIYLSGEYYSDGLFIVKIKDKGCGISNIKQAMQPMYSGSKSEERSGMGFSIMESFTDKLTVASKLGKGTTVTMKKYIGKEK